MGLGQPNSTAQLFHRPEPLSSELALAYPLLWEIAAQHDFTERLGGSNDPLTSEVDRAMQEIYWARMNARINGRTVKP